MVNKKFNIRAIRIEEKSLGYFCHIESVFKLCAAQIRRKMVLR